MLIPIVFAWRSSEPSPSPHKYIFTVQNMCMVGNNVPILSYHCLVKDVLESTRGARHAHNLPRRNSKSSNLRFYLNSQVTKPACYTISQDRFNARPVENQHNISTDSEQP